MLRWKSSLKPASGGGGGSGTNPGTANLVAAYDFDDSGGTGQNDLHTAGPYNLTENGTSAWTTGTPNYYSGATSADYLSSTGLSAAWASSEQDWSMVARYKDVQINRSPYWGGGSREYITFRSGNGHEGRIGGGTAVSVSTSASYAGQWVTVYMEYNSSTNKVTIKVLNENLSATSAAFTPVWADSEAIIGGRLGDGGDIDFMYFFSDLLTADEILWFGDNSSIARSYSELSGATDYRSTILADSPVAYWRLGESSGSTASDEVGSSDGTYGGDVTLGVTGALSGDSNTSISLAGSSTQYDGVTVSSLATASYSSGITIEFWANWDSTNYSGFGIEAYRDSNNRIFLDARGSSPHWDFRIAGTWYSAVGAGFQDGWHLYAFTHDGTNAKTYRDGVLQNTQSASATTFDSTSMGIGQGSAGYNVFTGGVDEAAIYNSALSATELLAHYTAGTSGAAAPNDNFEFTVTTTTASETFTIPCQNVGTFDATVDWGDGSTSTITAYNDADLVHTYATAGDHNISISGTFPNIYFNNGGDKLKVKSVTNLGSVGWTSLSAAFFGCSNMTSFTAGDCDTSSVTNMGYMFRSCSSLTSLDVSSFNTSSATNMFMMFRDCSSLSSLDVSSFGTSSVTNMGYMFYGCSSLTSLDVSSFNTSSVTSMLSTFRSCSSLTSLDLSSFTTTSVTRMDAMFQFCSSLTSLNVSSFNTSNVTTMLNMFNGCSSLTSLDLSLFNTSAVTSMNNMFKSMGGGTAQLTITGIEDFDITALTANRMTSFMAGTGGLSTTVYDELLVNWEAQTGYNAQNPHFGGSKYTAGSAAATARADLVTAGWTITDGGTA